MKSYEVVEKYGRRLAHLSHLKAMAGWDEAVMMPRGGADARAAALAELAAVMTEIYRHPEFVAALNESETQVDQLEEWQRANLREARIRHRHMMAIDPKLYELKVAASIGTEQIWRELRAANNWADFVPHFKKLVALVQEEGRQRGSAARTSAYEALVDLYEPGLKVATIETVFNNLKAVLPGKVDQIVTRQKRDRIVELGRPVPVEQQRTMMREYMDWLGFDFQHGRLDESHHPFCGGVPLDVRLTTRYSESEFLSGLMGVLHETGHAMYEQGLPRKWFDQPVGEARGMSVHESQSLFVEMQIGRSREFYDFAAPMLRQKLSQSHDPKEFWQPENLFRIASKVEKSLIRVEADEATYPAHIILRYELERAIVEGQVSVEEIPAIWDEKMRSYLGLSTAGDFRNGCMQDVHWPSGSFGYFPCYTLGALVAAQLFASLERDLPQARALISRGEVAPLMDWLRKKIWSQGSRYVSEDLLKRATGEGLNVDYFLNHLDNRYLAN